MRVHSFTFTLAAFGFFQSVHCLSNLHDNVVTLSPINTKLYENAVGLQARATKEQDFSELDPKDQARLIYGHPGENGQIYLADVVLHAPSGLKIVMLERFEGLTTSVDCKGDDGSMSLTFKSKKAFDQALRKWDFINEDEEEKFLLIANHDGCGPDDERQPYLITNIQDNRSTLTTFLTAQVAQWSDIAGDFEASWGKINTPNSRRSLDERGFFDDLGKLGKSVIDGVVDGANSIGSVFSKIGDVDLSKTVAFDVGIGEPGVRTNIITNSAKTITIDCIDCYVKGGFQVTGYLKVKNFSIKEFVIDASPQDVVAKLELQAIISASETLLSIDQSKELFAVGIPGAGIAVTGIFKLGATGSYSVGVSSTFQGNGLVDFGIQATLPNAAKVRADNINRESSSAVGFGQPSITPLFNVKSLSASVGLTAYSRLKVSFGIEVVKIGHVDTAIVLQVPKVTAQLNTGLDPSGFCAKTADASSTGVKLDSKVDVDVSVNLDAGLGSNKNNPLFEKTLFTVSQPLLALCIPLPIPGLSAVSPQGIAPVAPDPTVPSTTPIPPVQAPVAEPIAQPASTGLPLRFRRRSSEAPYPLFREIRNP